MGHFDAFEAVRQELDRQLKKLDTVDAQALLEDLSREIEEQEDALEKDGG